MSVLFQFEKTIENAIVDFLVANGINAHPGRNIETISRNSVEAIFEYGGAMEEPRQTLGGKVEYNAHEGTISLLVSTTREEGNDHNETLGKVRQLFLNSRNGLSASGYNFLDLLPLGSVTTEQEEGNQDATVLQYTLKYLIDLNIPTAPPVKPSNIVSGTYPAAPTNVASAAYPTAPGSIQIATEPTAPANIDLAKSPNKPSNVLIEDPFKNRWGVNFNGTGSHLSFASNPGITVKTVSFWFNQQFSKYTMIVSGLGGAVYQTYGGFGTNLNGGIRWNDGFYGANSASNLFSYGTWNHFLATHVPTNYTDSSGTSTGNGGGWAVYLNNTRVDITTAIGIYGTTPVETTDKFKIGREGERNTYQFNGKIDEVAVFNISLSISEISDIYNNGTPTNILDLNPSGYWRMGDETADNAADGDLIAQITDSSGNGNHATQATAANQPTFTDLTGESIYV